MNKNRNLIKYYNLRMFDDPEPATEPVTEPANQNRAADFAPAISTDFTSRITENIQTLQTILGITNMTPMAAGTLIKVYKWADITLPAQVGEGEVIPLTKAQRELAKTIELGLGKHRRQTTAEAIQKVGRAVAINQADEQLVSQVRKDIKSTFFTAISTGTGLGDAGSAATLQGALAKVWGKLQKYYEDKDVTPVYFVSSEDVADYLGSAAITVQTAFGFSYIENFLGLGLTIVNPTLSKGQVIGTARENLNGAYVPATGGDLSQAFSLTSDSTGLVGMTHQANTSNASIDTLLFCSVVFYPEFIDGVFKATISGT
jgi:hypothetical protein